MWNRFLPNPSRSSGTRVFYEDGWWFVTRGAKETYHDDAYRARDSDFEDEVLIQGIPLWLQTVIKRDGWPQPITRIEPEENKQWYSDFDAGR